jgi:peptide/nickel transport system substrate-binding protein
MKTRLLAPVLVLALFAAACGGGSGGGGGSGSGDSGVDGAASSDDAVVRFAADLVGARKGGFTWVPWEAGTSGTGADVAIWHWVYGGLFRPAPDGTLVPDLAQELKIVDGNTLEVILREGIDLPDGSTLDAEMVKDALEHNLGLEASAPRGFYPEFFELESVEVVDPTTVRLSIPNGKAAGWADNFLAGLETVIVPPGTDLTKPAGAGPFRVAEYVPETRVVLEKNPEYWDAESIKVGRIELVNAPDFASGVTALKAGQVDWARADVETGRSISSPHEQLVEPAPEFVANFQICKDEEPFSDPRVRQALSMAIDREAMNDALLEGLGEPAWGLWPVEDRFHNPDVTDVYAYDPEGARDLLADAGYPDGFTFETLTFPFATAPEIAEIAQQQFAEIGVTMNIRPSTNPAEDFSVKKLTPVSVTPTMQPWDRKLQNWVGPALGNTCGYDDPGLDALAEELGTVSRDSDDAERIWHAIDQLVVEDALSIFVYIQPRVSGFDPRRLSNVHTMGYTTYFPEVRELEVSG